MAISLKILRECRLEWRKVTEDAMWRAVYTRTAAVVRCVSSELQQFEHNGHLVIEKFRPHFDGLVLTDGGVYTHERLTIETSAGNTYCAVQEHAFFGYCNRTEQYMDMDDMIWCAPLDERVCADWYNEYVSTCDDCGGEYLANDGCGCEFSCEYIQDSTRANPLSILPGDNCFLHTPRCGETPLFMGLELEVECTKLKESAEFTHGLLKDFFILKPDGSLNNGFEAVSTPATLAAWRKTIAPKFNEFLDKAADNGMRSYNTKTCGIHIHLSRKAIAPLTLGKMLVHLNAENNRDFVETVAQRPHNSYCRPLDKPKPTNIYQRDDDQHDLSNRYQALNLCNVNTVELRIFKGTLARESVWKNLEYATAIVRFCEQASIQALAQQDFLDWLVKPENRIEYPHLFRFLHRRNFFPKFKLSKGEYNVPVDSIAA